MTAWKPLVLAALLILPAACGKKPEPVAEAPVPAAPAPAAGPALWTTGDADTKVYLLGTVHILPPGLVWKTAKIDTALAEAKTVYFETDIQPDPSKIAGMVEELGIYPEGQRLSDRLTAEQKTQLAKVAADLAMPMLLLENMKPWLAAMTISEQLITKAGYDPNSGVERTLEPLAKTAGKEIRILETVEEQLLAFADLPEKVQVAYLMDGVEEMDEEQALLQRLVEAWSKGDVAGLEAIMIEGDLKKMPEVYDALLVKRNANWTVKLDKLIADEPGVFLVAVGAAHLAGEDSVVRMLTDKGRTVTRLE